MKISKAFILFAFTGAMLSLEAQTRYVVTDLGSLGGLQAFASSINNAGQVSGYANLSTGDTRGYRTGPNRAINPATDVIGTLGGTYSAANSINSSGQVAGTATDAATPYPRYHAIRVDANSAVVHDLGTLGVLNNNGNGINDSGQVTGASGISFAFPACVSYESLPGFLTEANAAINPATDSLGTLLTNNCRYSTGYGVNNAGQVVGSSAALSDFNPEVHAMYKPAGSPMVDLGLLGGTSTFPAATGKSATAYAINASGQIVGSSSYNSAPYTYATHAFLTTTSAGPMTDLGTLGGSFSTATAINSAGLIVGNSTLAGDTSGHAFLYAGGVMSDLNSMIAPGSGWQIENATGINDNAQIVGTAWLNGVQYVSHAVRLDPASVAVSILTAQLVGFGLPNGTLSSLLTKLQDATAAIQIGDFSSAIGDLGAFVNSINAQTGKKIPAPTASALIAAASAIKAQL